MSRFSADDSKGRSYVYGFDRPLRYFFLSRVSPGPVKHLVGLLSATVRKDEVYGSAANLLEFIRKLKIKVPEQHIEDLLMDLPLSEIP